MPERDPVPYYTTTLPDGTTVECIDLLRALLPAEAFVAHCRASAFQYLWRAGAKGLAEPDLRKAATYCTWAADAVREVETVSRVMSEITDEDLATSPLRREVPRFTSAQDERTECVEGESTTPAVQGSTEGLRRCGACGEELRFNTEDCLYWCGNLVCSRCGEAQ